MKRLTMLFAASLSLLACDNPVASSVDSPAPPKAPAVLAYSITNTLTGVDLFSTSAVFPSTNAINNTNGWARVLFVDVAVGQVTLNFVSSRAFFSCFEYRIDDEIATSTQNGGINYNLGITDGLWNYTCLNNNSVQMTFIAQDHVDIRMGFGAEEDERFNWTRFYVLSTPLENKDQCKNGDWEALGFKNQGQCVRFVETGKDSRNGG